MKCRGIGFRIAMRPGKRRVLPDSPEGRLDDLIETAKRISAPKDSIRFG
jgi:IS5 family transposase